MTSEYLIEVKGGTYNTEGTALEKTLGVPIKYSEVPLITGKPVLIIGVGKAEKYLKCEGLLSFSPPVKGVSRHACLDFFEKNNFYYLGFSEIFNEYLIRSGCGIFRIDSPSAWYYFNTTTHFTKKLS